MSVIVVCPCVVCGFKDQVLETWDALHEWLWQLVHKAYGLGCLGNKIQNCIAVMYLLSINLTVTRVETSRPTQTNLWTIRFQKMWSKLLVWWDSSKFISKTGNQGLSFDPYMSRTVRIRCTVILVVDTTITCMTVFGSRAHCGSFGNVINMYALTLFVYIQGYKQTQKESEAVSKAPFTKLYHSKMKPFANARSFQFRSSWH